MRDVEGQSPLDNALDMGGLKDGCMDVTLYLMNRGCGGDKDKAKFLCISCYHGNLGVVKELVEQYKVDPKSECDNAIVSSLIRALSKRPTISVSTTQPPCSVIPLFLHPLLFRCN